MKKKYPPIICFAFISILVSSLSLDCTKKSTEPLLLPSWHTIIRDYKYLERTFYDLGFSADFDPGDSITEIRLFKSNDTINSNIGEDKAPLGMAYVDPADTLAQYHDGVFLRRFKEIDPTTYHVDRNQHWIRLCRALEKADILAVFYLIRHYNSTCDTVGFIKDSCLASENNICMHLKLIKPYNPRPDYYTWEYEWKNVYYLGIKDISRERFGLQIFKGRLNAESFEDPIDQDGTLYIQILGLDQLDHDGNENPDGMVDNRQIDFDEGYLIFPNRHPFAPSPNVSYTGIPGDTLKEQVDAIYKSNQLQDQVEQSKYYICIKIYTWQSYSY
jgi:cell surface protein SprA